MCKDTVCSIYLLFIFRGGRRSLALESLIDFFREDFEFTEDLIRNEELMYEELFSLRNSGYFFGLYKQLMFNLKGLERKSSGDVLAGLEFIQDVSAKALWKFGCDLKGELKGFARDFDRLDVPEEKERLYTMAQV